MKMQGPKQKQGQNVGTKRAFTPFFNYFVVYLYYFNVLYYKIKVVMLGEL